MNSDITTVPPTPVKGLPHLKMIDGEWFVVVGEEGTWTQLWKQALAHARYLNTLSKTHGLST